MFDISVILITNDGSCAVLQQGLNGRVVRAGFLAFDEAPTNAMPQSKNAWSKRGLGSHMFMVLKLPFTGGLTSARFSENLSMRRPLSVPSLLLWSLVQKVCANNISCHQRWPFIFNRQSALAWEYHLSDVQHGTSSVHECKVKSLMGFQSSRTANKQASSRGKVLHQSDYPR